MSTARMSEPMTEMVVYHLKECVNLENVASDPGSAGQAFVQLTNTVKAQPGCIRQFWGHEVEHPHLFCWSTDWESFEHHTAFINSDSEEGSSFKARLSQVFEVEKTPPVTLYIHIANQDAANMAMRSGITEVAFFIMPDRPDEETRSAIEEGSVDSLREVETIGKATGSTIGWVIDAVPYDLVTGPDSIDMYGVFGYANLDVHLKWRETPEAIRAGEAASTMTPATAIPGVDAKTGYFHVKFQEGE